MPSMSMEENKEVGLTQLQLWRVYAQISGGERPTCRIWAASKQSSQKVLQYWTFCQLQSRASIFVPGQERPQAGNLRKSASAPEPSTPTPLARSSRNRWIPLFRDATFGGTIGGGDQRKALLMQISCSLAPLVLQIIRAGKASLKAVAQLRL